MPILRTSVDVGNKKLFIDHDSASISNGDVDIVNRALRIIAQINSFDPVDQISCKRYPPTLNAWDIEIKCATGHWNVRYLMDGFDPKIITTIAITEIRTSLIVLMQELRAICTELIVIHALDDLKFI